MVNSRRKGYRVERNTRLLMESRGWKVIRAGRSIGEADLVCIKQGKCVLLQIKSTKKPIFYYDGYMDSVFENMPFYLVVDFGYGNVRILPPKERIKNDEGIRLKDFIK